jgi:uncharacterized protein YndB with AHSA1/START domain
MTKLSDKFIEKSIIISSTPSELFQKWTTTEGLKTFFGEDNTTELKPFGAFEIYFLQDAPIGGRGSEGCQVLAFVPNEMFSFTWNAPPHLEARTSDHKTFVVVNFDEITEAKTMVTLRHLGWPDEELFIPVYDYFDNAWDYVLNNLEESCK